MPEILVIRKNGGNPCGLQEETDQIGAAIDLKTEEMRQQYPNAKILAGCVSCSGCVFLAGGLANCTLEARDPENYSDILAPKPRTRMAVELLGSIATFNPEGADVTKFPDPKTAGSLVRLVA